MAQARKFDLNTVKEFARQCSNWGKWGVEDELGTINYIIQAARCLTERRMGLYEVMSKRSIKQRMVVSVRIGHRRLRALGRQGKAQGKGGNHADHRR